MNPNLAIEVCSLQEAGFKLADYQRDLVFIQKIFLNEAYPLYNKHIKELSENPDSTSPSQKESWREEYRRKVEEKRQREG